MLVTDFFWRTLRFRMWTGGGRRDSRDGGAGAALMVVAVLLSVIAPLFARIIQLAASREREYLADAGAVELTRNPDAMISALAKIDGHSRLGNTPDEMREMFIENPRVGFMGMFATHPPIPKRIDALVEHAGGKRPHPTVPQAE